MSSSLSVKALRRLQHIKMATEILKTPGLVLLTAGTPNGHKPSIALEELKAVGAIPGYVFKAISFSNSEQKEDWFMKINPNGRIPALVDNRAGKGPINVWESASILLYLARVYDTKFAFHFEDEDVEAEMINWIFFIQGGLGPMQGQSHHFLRYAPEKIPYGINRYQTETRRLYKTYDDHLATGVDYLVGNKYSYADMCTFPWVRFHGWAGIETLDEYPHLSAWLERITLRPAVTLGLNCPEEDTISLRRRDPAAADAKAAQSSKWIMENLEREAKALAAKKV